LPSRAAFSSAGRLGEIIIRGHHLPECAIAHKADDDVNGCGSS
jgi:hypothetical protein